MKKQKIHFNQANTQSSFGEPLKEKRKTLVYWFVFPFQFVQCANTELMS